MKFPDNRAMSTAPPRPWALYLVTFVLALLAAASAIRLLLTRRIWLRVRLAQGVRAERCDVRRILLVIFRVGLAPKTDGLTPH